MTTQALLEALARLRVETGSLACLGCGHEHHCSVHGCQILREAAALIEDQTTTIRGLRFRLTGYHMEDSFNRGLLIAESQRRRKAEAERDALLEIAKKGKDCETCRNCAVCVQPGTDVAHWCDRCVEKCLCYGCGGEHWEWRGLPEAPEEGETHGTGNV